MPLVMVHLTVTTDPAATPVTVVVGDEGEVMVAEPVTRDQVPVPIVGVFAAMVKVEVLHKV